MNLHPVEIATQIAPDAHAANLVDQAKWHLPAGLSVVPNTSLILLPAKYPELNPQGTSGSSCATIGYRTGSSNPLKTSTIVATPGTSSSINLGNHVPRG